MVRDVTFQVFAGEIVALAGLAGAGRTETALAIFGASRKRQGEVRVFGKTLAPTPAAAIAKSAAGSAKPNGPSRAGRP